HEDVQLKKYLDPNTAVLECNYAYDQASNNCKYYHEARMMFRQTLLESTQQIDNLTKKLGKCVEQSRPYYEARIKAKQALTEAQKSAVRYERAVSQHAAAREMVHLAEEGLLTRGCIFDSTWQEMLNHATTKVYYKMLKY
ncbi:SH3 domain-binding protein 5-like, partial [Armadillidium nasatum]